MPPHTHASGEADAAFPSVLPTYRRSALTFERGEGCWLFTPEGERYLDFGAGIAVNALGHCHPKAVAALTEQAHKLWHTSNLYEIPGQKTLADKLTRQSFADTVFFCNSGAEALEGAIKTVRKYHSHHGRPERYRLVTFEGAFHGRTLATIAAGGQDKHLAGFGPPVDGFDQVPFGDLEAAAAAVGPHTAGILIEPIQGEGGIREVPPETLRGLRRLCDDRGLLLVMDEVQAGMGRTGKLFAHEWSGVRPDVVASAKGIGGGFPLGAFLMTEEAAAGMTAGSHGSTYGGNPLAMAVGNAVLDALLEADFLDRVVEKGRTFAQKLGLLLDRHPGKVAEIRGTGLMRGLRFAPSLTAADAVKAALSENLLTVPAGDNVMRLLPPLVVSDAEMDDAVDRLDRALAAV